MMGKYPIIFLAHSKKDKVIIERLAIGLRKYRINAWYDEWEIPAGRSLRENIFSQGISGCDAFFVYLTPNSLLSKWVREEIDSAFIKIIEGNASFIPAISDPSLVDKIPLDIRTKKLVLLNEEEYNNALVEITVSVYEDKLSKVTKECKDEISKITKRLESRYNQDLEIEKHKRQVKEKELKMVKDHLLETYKNVQDLIPPIFHDKLREIIKLPKSIIEERNDSFGRADQKECPACFGNKSEFIREESVYHGGADIGYITVVKCCYCGQEFEISDVK